MSQHRNRGFNRKYFGIHSNKCKKPFVLQSKVVFVEICVRGAQAVLRERPVLCSLWILKVCISQRKEASCPHQWNSPLNSIGIFSYNMHSQEYGFCFVFFSMSCVFIVTYTIEKCWFNRVTDRWKKVLIDSRCSQS